MTQGYGSLFFSCVVAVAILLKKKEGVKHTIGYSCLGICSAVWDLIFPHFLNLVI